MKINIDKMNIYNYDNINITINNLSVNGNIICLHQSIKKIVIIFIMNIYYAVIIDNNSKNIL